MLLRLIQYTKRSFAVYLDIQSPVIDYTIYAGDRNGVLSTLCEITPGLDHRDLHAIGDRCDNRDHQHMGDQEDQGERDELKPGLHACSGPDKQDIEDAVIDRMPDKGTPQVVRPVVEVAVNDSRDECRDR